MHFTGKLAVVQRRRQNVFRGGRRLADLKAITRPPPGATATPPSRLRMVAKFHFLKRFKVLENEFTFQKYQHFSEPKNSFFSQKNFEN